MMTLEEMGIDKLAVAERIALAQEILESIAAEQPEIEAVKQLLQLQIDDARARFTLPAAYAQQRQAV